MVDRRVPAKEITEGRRLPVILSSQAETQLERLAGPSRGTVAARLLQLSRGSRSTKTIQSDRQYSITDADDHLVIYRLLDAGELTAQGYPSTTAERGGLFVVAILSADELGELLEPRLT